MPVSYGLDLYPASAPKSGTRLVRFTKLQRAEYKATANGTGAGMIALRGTETDAGYIDPDGNQYVRVERLGDPVTLALSAAADDIVDTTVAHGLTVGNKVEFPSLTGGAGLSTTPVYFVVAVPTSTSLQVSATRGGAAVDFTTDITAGSIRKLTTVGGFFLEHGDFEALTAKQTKLLTFSGAGALAILDRAIMWSHTYMTTFVAQDPFDGIWRLYNQSTVYAGGDHLGAILWRVVTEAKNARTGATYTHKHADGVTYTDSHADDRTASVLGDVTLGFSGTADSGSTGWTKTSGDFTAQVGDSVLSVVKRLMEAGLYVEMDPDTFELDAWEQANHGRTRTGVAWGTNVIRFQAPSAGTVATGNILSDAIRGLAARVRRSILLVGGADVYAKATDGTNVAWEGFYPSEAADTTALGDVAAVQIGARNDAGDTVRLRFKLDNDPANGKYLPFEAAGILPDDLVTLHTGSGQWDWNEAAYPVAAVAIKLRDGGDWTGFVDLGSQYVSIEERQFQDALRQVVRQPGSHTHPPNPRLCTDGTTDFLLGLTSGSLKASGEGGGFVKANACDGSLSTHWSDALSTAPPEGYWAADVGSAKRAVSYRIVQGVYLSGAYTGTPRDATTADEIRIYGSNDPAAWSWLPAGKLTADPAANGWTLVHTDTSGAGPANKGDTGVNQFAAAATYRYWLFRAVTGGSVDDGWDLGIVELREVTDKPQPLAQDGEGTHGVGCSCAARGCHEHEHGDLSASAGTHHAATSVRVTDSAGHYDATQVEAGLQEAAEVAFAAARIFSFERFR